MVVLGADLWVAAVAVTLLAGFVKGVVGFALPLIMISGLASFLPVEMALAALIIPTVVLNGVQVLRDGPAAALASARRFRLFIVIVIVSIAASAQLFRVLPASVLLLVLGLMIVAFTLMQLVGWRLRVRPGARRRTEVAIGLAAGAIGGVTGVWGPLTVMLLTALEVPKREHVRIQGAVYSISAVALALAHVRSGVLTASTAAFSTAMLVPALAGMWVGLQVQDRLDQERFRRATLVVLALTGVNLLRRALF